MRRLPLLSLLLISSFAPVQAQTNYGPRAAGEVLIAIVPVIGSGSYDDPRRPQLVPLKRFMDQEALDYRFVLSDDGRTAIVAFRALDREKLAGVLEARRQGVKVFERGLDSRSTLEQEARKYKRSFVLEDLLGIPKAPGSKAVQP